MAKVVRNRIEKPFITTISSVSHEGKGIAYQDDKTIVIDNALLNEEVEYRIIKKVFCKIIIRCFFRTI